MHIVDKEDKAWPLRSVMANNLVQIIEGNFSMERMEYTDVLSKYLNFALVLV